MSRHISVSAWLSRQFLPDRVWGVVAWALLATTAILVVIIALPIYSATRAPTDVRLSPMSDKDAAARATPSERRSK